MSNFKFQMPNSKSISFWIILVILLAIPSFSTLLQPGYFGMHDDIQIMRIYEMDKCIKDLQIPCRWVPDMGYGYGYPLFNFYPVMPYYLGEAIHILGFNLIWSVKIDFILSYLVAAITMFLLARVFWGNLGGLISSLFYLYAPYHADDVYVRGAMAENWSLAWAPAVFLFIYRTIEKNSLTNITFLALFSALFLMSHNPLALIFTPIMTVWALILIWRFKKFASIRGLIFGGFWALGLASFFTLPVLVEGKLVHLETLFIGYFNYLAHFIDLKQMFTSTFWGYGGSIWGPDDGMPFMIGYLHTGAIVISLTVALALLRKEITKSIILVFMAAVFFSAAFLMHPKSNFIWEKVTILQNLQFPWRILSIVIIVSSFVAGSVVTFKTRESIKVALALVLIFAIAALYQPYFKIEKPISLTDQEKLSGTLWNLQRTAGIFDYLPKSAKLPPGSPAPDLPRVLRGEANISDYQAGSNWLSFKVESTSSATLRLPIIYFPQWKVYVDNREQAFDIDNREQHSIDRFGTKDLTNELGQPTFEVGSGSHKVFAKLYNTPIRTISNLISLASLIALLFTIRRLLKK